MALIQSTAIPSGATDYELEQSLKFNDDDTPYLSRTNSSAGSSRTWTFSCWVKTNSPDGNRVLISAGGSGANEFIRFDAGQIRVYFNSISADIKTTAVYRDMSSWYNIIVVMDTTQGTAANRIKIYVNGSQVTDLATSTYPAQNADITAFNNTGKTHTVGSNYNIQDYINGYLAEVNFIDGQALTPADFGETGDYGEWKPIEYSGTYGTNGFYLPFKQDYTVEGFSTVIYTGNDETSQYIGGVGFQPDLVWIKERSGTVWAHLFDSVRGVNKALTPHETTAENTTVVTFPAFNSDGFTVGDGNLNGETDAATASNVAWNWDMGGSNASNTDGSITSTVRANPTYGQSIVSYTGTGANATVGHGLSSAPEMVILKRRNAAGDDWAVNMSNISGISSSAHHGKLNSSVAFFNNNSIWFNNTNPSSTLISLGSHATVNASSATMIAYCFHSVTGYSKFGTYTGNGSATGTVVTTGFAPAFVMIKRTDAAKSWFMADNTRNPNNAVGKYNFANLSDAEYDYTRLNFTSTGFQLATTDNTINNSGSNYIYMAFADKREYAYWLDQSGNNNDWTSNNLTESDISVDSPTNNFATMNPLDSNSNITLAEGNLKYIATGGWYNLRGSMFVSSGKWYWEMVKTTSTSIYTQIGAATSEPTLTEDYGDAQNGMWIYSAHNGTKVGQGTSPTSYGASYVTGDVMGIALDMDNGTITFYKNNVSQGQAFSGITGDVAPWISGYNNNNVYNFGQDSSFAGAKTAQGNQDGNDIGDFYYTPPTGFLALCTKNLPDVAVTPSEHFNTVLWAGTGSSNAISVGFQPDFVWLKARDHTYSNILQDSVRGAGKEIRSNATLAEVNRANSLTSFDSNGFTVTTDAAYNNSGNNYVAWNWKAGTSVSGNTTGAGTAKTYTGSVNTDNKFSIIKYTGNGTANHTIPHNLGVVPEFFAIKSLEDGENWAVYHKGTHASPETMMLKLNATSANADVDSFLNDVAPTSSVINLGVYSRVNENDETFIAYCWASVDGYSKVGSYTGNGSSDGTFVYTGFNVKWLLIKRTDSTSSWTMLGNKRDTDIYNPITEYLAANASDAEGTYQHCDFVSNGIKFNGTGGDFNGSGGTYIYIAFAETPFKYSNAR